MRLEHRRDYVVSLLIAAALAASLLPSRAIAQGPQRGGGFQGGGRPGGPGGGPPGSFQGQPGQPQPGQPEATAAAAPAAPADLDAIPIDSSPLARYVPSEATGVYLEFPGLNAAPGAWEGSAARGILNETSFGEMLRQLVSQAVEVAPGAPAGVMTGPEVTTIAEHIARNGLVLASPQDFDRGSRYLILVLRKAAHREVRGLFGKLVGTIAAPGAKPQVVSKPGNRQVVVMDTPAFGNAGSGTWAWWIEGDDLAFVFNDAEGVDRVIAAIDGQQPNAVDDPMRQELMAAEGSFQPVAFAAWRLDRPGASPNEVSMARENGLNRIDLRWGFDGKESLSVVRLPSAAPRSGMMTLFDQPVIPLSELPPIPTEATDLSVISVDLAKLFDAIRTLAEQGDGAFARQLSDFEQVVKTRARFELRDELLASLGPKIATYTLPKPESRPAGGNPIAGVMNALGGLGLPQFVVAIEVKDAAAFTQKLDGLILAINEQIGTATAQLQPPPPAEPEGGAPRQGDNQRPETRPDPPKFSMTLAQPRTYLLKLPEGLYGLTGYQPTITLGKQYLILATNPVAARQCRELEAAEAPGRWTADGELAGRLPTGVTMLFVSDPSQKLPAAIASLPEALNLAMNPPRVTPAGGAPPGGQQAMASGGREGREGLSGGPGPIRSGGPGTGQAYPGSSGAYGSSGPPAAMLSGGAVGNSSGGSRGMSGPGGAQAAKPGTIQIAPDLIPSTDALRRFLFPSLYTVSVDDAGIRLEARETLPGQWGLSGLGNGTAIPLQMIPQFGSGGAAEGN